MRTLVIASLFVSSLAFAQSNRTTVPIPAGEPVTQGVYNPTIGVAGDGDASSTDKNPAALGTLRSWSAVYFHTELDPTQIVGGRGDAVFLASPLPFARNIVLGVGVQSIRPPDLFPFRDQVKLSLAMAWKLSRAVTFGWSVATLYSVKGPSEQTTTLDLSLASRFNRYLAGALVVRDVTNPTYQGLPLQRVYEPELAIRPLGNARIEVAAAARIGERRGDVDPRFRLWIAPVPGLTFKADVEWRRDVDLDGINENDVRVALGVAFDLDRVGLSGFGLFGRDEGSVRGHGFTLAARISGERYATVFTGPHYIEKYKIDEEVSGRKLTRFVAHLRRLEREKQLDGIIVTVGAIGGSWATAEELRGALLRLREKGKHVFAYIAETDTRGYYVASAAERVLQDPAGGIRLQGLSSTALFFKGTGDLLGVKADFVKIAEYKSAPERFTRTSSSEPAKAQRDAFVNDVYRHLTESIGTARRMSPEQVMRVIDGGPYTAEGAKNAGLVDELASTSEIETLVSRAVDNGSHRFVVLRDPVKNPERSQTWWQPRVAIIHIDGEIVDGKSQTIPFAGMHVSGAQTLVPAIIAARNDAQVKAVVLRINSPGGSALASELIARELQETTKIKPVICSMSDLAASGGYFVAAPCQKIFALPSTLTGSIGIYTGKFDVSGLAARLGITFEKYERGANAGIDSMWQPYTDEERKLILDRLTYYYNRFVNTVARGRKRTFAQIDAVAHGRIWSGDEARGQGLVDAYGGINDAIDEAKRAANINEQTQVDLIDMPREPGLLGQIGQLLGIEMKAKEETSSLPSMVTGVLRALPASLIMAPSTPQARMDVGLDIE